jgi:type I restriction enzyme S subunit
MAEKAKVPAIRFKGFSDAWEQRRLFDNVRNIIDFRGRTPKKLGLDWSESGYLALSALNVKDGYIDPSVDAHYGNQELYDKWMTGHELREGQVLFTTEAPMGNVAQVPDNMPYILSQRTIAFDVQPEMITDDFLFVLLRSPNVFAALSALSSGGTAKGVSQKSMSQLCVIVPKDLGEQTQIASFFKNIDNLITLHQRKLLKLKNVKKAMLEKMFPQNGSNVPEIRFAGFTDAWEHRKLSASVIRLSDMSINAGLPRVEYEDIVAGQGALNEGFSKKKSSKVGIAFGKDDILFGKLRPYLKNWLLADFPGIAVGDFWVLRAINANSGYVYYLIQTPAFQMIANQSTGTKMPRSDWNLVSKAEFNIPAKVEEQSQIGAFLRKLDHLITLHQCKLEKLQNIKKSMLEKMFV